MDEIKRQIAELGAAWKEFQTVHAAAMAEVKARGATLGETEVKLRKLDEAIAKADEAKTKAEAAQAMAEKVLLAAKNTPSPGYSKDELKDHPAVREYKAKLFQWMRTNDPSLQHECHELHRALGEKLGTKTLSSLTDPDGGVFLSPDLESGMLRYEVESSPIRQIARIRPTSRSSVKGRLRQARAGGIVWVGEPDTRGLTGTPQAGEWEIHVREAHAMPDAPLATLEDADEDLEQWLLSEASDELTLGENTALVNGDGLKKPRGFMTYPTGTDPLQSQIEQVATVTNDVFAADDLILLQGALKEGFQGNATWVLSRQMLTNVRRFTLGSVVANYVWQPGLQAGVPSVILGRPYLLCGDMPIAVADAALIVAYGDFRRGYLIVDRRGISVLRNPYAVPGYVRFQVSKRVGGGVVNFEAIKILRVQ